MHRCETKVGAVKSKRSIQPGFLLPVSNFTQQKRLLLRSQPVGSFYPESESKLVGMVCKNGEWPLDGTPFQSWVEKYTKDNEGKTVEGKKWNSDHDGGIG